MTGASNSSKSLQGMLAKYGMKGSMSRPGCPYDNACAESFFLTAKRECINRKYYATVEEVKTNLFAYIELFYYRKRMLKLWAILHLGVTAYKILIVQESLKSDDAPLRKNVQRRRTRTVIQKL